MSLKLSTLEWAETLWSLGSQNREVGTTGVNRASFHIAVCVTDGGTPSTGLVLRVVSGMGVSSKTLTSV